jgi:hypothetical protein
VCKHTNHVNRAAMQNANIIECSALYHYYSHSPLAADNLVAAIYLNQTLLAAATRAGQRGSKQLLTRRVWRRCCCPERSARHSLMLISPRYTAAAALQRCTDGTCHCVCARVAVLVRLHL